MKKLCNEQSVKSLTDAVNRIGAAGELKIIDHAAALFPEQEKARLITELGTAKAERVYEIRAELAKLSAPETEAIAGALRRCIIQENYVPYTAALKDLAQECLRLLEVWHAEAKESEAAWLRENSLPTGSETPLGRVYTGAIAHCRNFISGLAQPFAMPHGFLPQFRNPFVDWVMKA